VSTVADPDWESRDGHYRVRLYGEWIDVPDDALITEPNRLGRTMVWADAVQGRNVSPVLHAGQYDLGHIARGK